MKADILSIGTELLMGELTDTNATFIASQLPALGIQVQGIAQVGDDLELLVQTFNRVLDRSDIVFTTGGLGPTQDDLTREAIAKAMGEEMQVEDDLVKHLEAFFRGRNMPMPQRNLKQATLIPSARTIPNRRGTAPGWWVGRDGKYVVAMPGPPGELHDMWEQQVLPALQKLSTGEVIITRSIKTMGLSEAVVDEIVAPYFGSENPYLGIYAKPDGIHLRIIARASDETKARKLIEPLEEGITQLLEAHIWGYDDLTPEETAIHLLKERSLTLATMEQCSGGLLASTITEANDSSLCFRGGLVSYSNDSLVANGIPASLIQTHGAVSPEVAAAMAMAAKERLQAQVGIGITGVSGPEEIEGKPIGIVHTAIALNNGVNHYPSHLPPRRSLIRQRAVTSALVELCRLLKQA